MPFDEPTLWGALGTVLGAAATFLLGLFRIRSNERQGMSAEQRKMLREVWQHHQTQDATIASLHEDLREQRDYYEAKLMELEMRCREDMAEQRKYYEARIRDLEEKIDRLQELDIARLEGNSDGPDPT